MKMFLGIISKGKRHACSKPNSKETFTTQQFLTQTTTYIQNSVDDLNMMIYK